MKNDLLGTKRKCHRLGGVQEPQRIFLQPGRAMTMSYELINRSRVLIGNFGPRGIRMKVFYESKSRPHERIRAKRKRVLTTGAGIIRPDGVGNGGLIRAENGDGITHHDESRSR